MRRTYEVVSLVSGTNDCFDFALLDPNGLVVSRSAHESTLVDKTAELQEAYDLGFQDGVK